MKVEGIILAAGLSSRAGAYKMTLKIGCKAIIEKCIESMYDTCSRVIVVGGYRVDKIIPILSKYQKVELIYNRNYEDGMFSSVKEGLKNVIEERFFLTPGDYPLIGKEVYEAMLKIDGDIIIPVHNGLRGHPVLMKRFISEELLHSCRYSNLRGFISTKEPVLVDVHDQGILEDVDTMRDYERILKLPSNKEITGGEYDIHNYR